MLNNVVSPRARGRVSSSSSSLPSNHTPQFDVFLTDHSSSWSPDSCENNGSHCIKSLASNLQTPKSQFELRKEIVTLELEILHLERYLLSLYRRTAFEDLQPILSNSTSRHSKCTPEEPPVELKLTHHHDSSSSDSPGCSSSSFNKATPSIIRKQKTCRSGRHSLADHLGGSLKDDSFYAPDKLSQDIVRCISSIYCKFANANPGLSSASPISSLSSSSIFSSKNPNDSWSQHCNEEAATNICLKEENGAHDSVIEVLRICLNDDTFNYAAVTLENFRSLVQTLEKVDPRKMKREEKLAFWINIHNALVMHAYLAYGTPNQFKSTSLVKAAYNVGGQFINAHIIQTSILEIRSHYSAPWLQTLFSPGRKSKTASISSKHAYALEYPEPLVHFGLCSGSFSDPMVRVYTAKNIFHDLKSAKDEYIQSNVYIHKETKIYAPKLVYNYAKDMTLDTSRTLDAIAECLSEAQQKPIQKCKKGKPERNIHWLPQSSNFRYVFHSQVLPQQSSKD